MLMKVSTHIKIAVLMLLPVVAIQADTIQSMRKQLPMGKLPSPTPPTYQQYIAPNKWRSGATIVTWSDDGTLLTVSGSGAMGGYGIMWEQPFYPPWYDIATSITGLVIENGVSSIGAGAFYRSTGLTSVTISNSVTTIGDWAFSSCTGLKSIEIPNSVAIIGEGAFERCTGLKTITIPNSVAIIGEGAFYRCTGLKSIEIPNSVTTIGANAFERCTGLKSITIPSSVTTIKEEAFEHCTGLTSIIVQNPIPPKMRYDVFKNVNIDNICLYVPASSIDAYRTADVWKEFGYIKAIIPYKTIIALSILVVLVLSVTLFVIIKTTRQIPVRNK